MTNPTLQQQAIIDALGEFTTIETRARDILDALKSTDDKICRDAGILQQWAEHLTKLQDVHVADLIQKSDELERMAKNLVQHARKIVIAAVDAVAKEQSEKRLSALATVAAEEALEQIRPEIVTTAAAEITKIKAAAGDGEARIQRTVDAAIKKIVLRATVTFAGTGTAMILLYAIAAYLLRR